MTSRHLFSSEHRHTFTAFGAGALTAAGLGLAKKVTAIMRTGEGHSAKHRALDFASATAQPKYPLDAISTYLNGFHFYADDMGRQVEATHFCTHLRHDLHQCVIYDSNAADARLIGIEYIISAEKFATLPEDEKKLWHSHHYEVKSGMLVAPGIPDLAERSYFEDLVSTYGKTFHTWQYDKADFPFGIPQLMMGFTDDGQADENATRERDERLGVSTPDKRRDRADIPMPDVDPAANSWQSGRSVQTTLEDVDFTR